MLRNLMIWNMKYRNPINQRNSSPITAVGVRASRFSCKNPRLAHSWRPYVIRTDFCTHVRWFGSSHRAFENFQLDITFLKNRNLESVETSLPSPSISMLHWYESDRLSIWWWSVDGSYWNYFLCILSTAEQSWEYSVTKIFPHSSLIGVKRYNIKKIRSIR